MIRIDDNDAAVRDLRRSVFVEAAHDTRPGMLVQALAVKKIRAERRAAAVFVEHLDRGNGLVAFSNRAPLSPPAAVSGMVAGRRWSASAAALAWRKEFFDLVRPSVRRRLAKGPTGRYQWAWGRSHHSRKLRWWQAKPLLDGIAPAPSMMTICAEWPNRRPADSSKLN
jgi:hypothetical protein